MAVVGTNVTAANYNTIQGKINDVLGAGDGAQNGYGQTIQSSQKSAGDVIAATDMQQLYNDLIKARLHQTNPVTWTNADGLAAPSADENVGASAADVGDETPLAIFSLVASTEYMIVDTGDSDFTLIGASANEAGIKFTATGPGTGTGIAKLSPTSANAEEDQAEGYLDFEAAADEIVADINQHDADNFTISTVTSTRTNPWGGGDFASPGSKITNEVEITWLNSDQRRYFFNTGGEIRFNADLIGAVTASSKEDNWNTVLANMGTITFGKSATTADGSSPGSGSAIGNYYADWNLTSSSNRAVIYIKNGSGIYADIQYRIEAWEVAAGNASTPSTLRFRIEFQDNDYSSSPSDVDEYIDNDIESNVKIYHDTILGIPAPSLTTITALDDGIQNSVSANLTRNPATGSIDEGESVTFTLSVSPAANGTTIDYTLSGVGISVGDFDNSQGMGGVFTINSGIGSVTITAKNDETSEGAESLTCSVPALGLQQSIQINDTSTSPSPPPTPDTYSVTGPASLNEGNTGTYNLTTSDDDGTYYYSVSPAGVMTSDSGSFAVSSGAGSFNLTAANDAVVGDNETITVSVRLGSTSGTIVTSMSTSIIDTTVPPRVENLYAIEYYTVRDVDNGITGDETFASYGKTINRTKIASSNSNQAPTYTNVTEDRFYGGGDTGYSFAKATGENRIDVWAIGGGAGGNAVSVSSSSGGPAAGGGAGGAGFKQYLDNNIPADARIIVGQGGDGTIQESGSADFNFGTNGGSSSFAPFVTGSYQEEFAYGSSAPSFVFNTTAPGYPNTWVWKGKVLRTSTSSIATQITVNGITYVRGNQESLFNISTGGGETEPAFYYGIRRIENSGIKSNGGEIATTTVDDGDGGTSTQDPPNSSNSYTGGTSFPCTGTFNILQSSTGASINTGNGMTDNLPDGNLYTDRGTTLTNGPGIEEGARTNLGTDYILENLETQGGSCETGRANANAAPGYLNGLGVGAGGGGSSQRQARSRSGAGHPGMVAIARYRDSGSQKSLTEYTGTGTTGFISLSGDFLTSQYGYAPLAGQGSLSMNNTASGYNIGSLVITRTFANGSGQFGFSGVRFRITLELTGGNVPFEHLHSIDVYEPGNRPITFLKTQATQRAFSNGKTYFYLDTLDGAPALITSDDSNGNILTAGNNFVVVLRVLE